VNGLKTLIALVCVLAAAGTAWAENPRFTIQTNKGDIVVELDPQAAPRTVANFADYVAAGFYEGTVFHRVIPDFMIQGGGLTADLNRKPTRPPIPNEADNGLPNRRGTIAMARTSDPHSATSQFFINTKDNGFLDFRAKNAGGWGYCVFGKVVSGMAVVDAISAVPTRPSQGLSDVPVAPVIIERITATVP
jgi:peptidyl-prolyl cis-trans isomerase B (cyclophilin B)